MAVEHSLPQSEVQDPSSRWHEINCRGRPDTSGPAAFRPRATSPARRSNGRRNSSCRGAAAGRGQELPEIVEPLGDFRPPVDARAVERHDGGGGPREGAFAAWEHVPEAAVGVLAAADVADRAVDRLAGHEEPGVSRRPQGHHLANGDRDVGVASRTGWYRQPPSLFCVLTISLTALASFSRRSARGDVP